MGSSNSAAGPAIGPGDGAGDGSGDGAAAAQRVAAFRARLEALGERHADCRCGFFGPDSMSWRVNGEGLLLLGGLRALMMQVAHPKVAQGVADHSAFREDPLGRAMRTFEAVHAVVFGSRDDAIRAALKVYEMHERITGRLTGTGESYRANDPDLLLWVFATLVDSALATYELFFGTVSADERERFYAEGRLFAQLFGVDEASLPADWPAFEAWLAGTIAGPAIEVTPLAREIASALLSGTLLSKAMGPVNYPLAAGMLPPRLRDGYRLKWTRVVRLAYRATVAELRLVARLLPAGVRRLPVADEAFARCTRSQGAGH